MDHYANSCPPAREDIQLLQIGYTEEQEEEEEEEEEKKAKLQFKTVAHVNSRKKPVMLRETLYQRASKMQSTRANI